MELKDINISPWILEKEGNSFRLRKYFKTSEDLGDYFSKNNQFISVLEGFEETKNGYIVQVSMINYLNLIKKFKPNHSKYSASSRIEKILNNLN